MTPAASHFVALPPHPTIYLLLSWQTLLPPFIGYISLIPDMSYSPSASFLLIFNAALKDYQNQTGVGLVDHPFAKQLERCNSVDSISSLLQENAQRFRDFRGENGRIMKSLKRAVHVIHSTSNILGEGISLVRCKSFIPNFSILNACSIVIRTHKGRIYGVRSLALRESHFVNPCSYPCDG